VLVTAPGFNPGAGEAQTLCRGKPLLDPVSMSAQLVHHIVSSSNGHLHKQVTVSVSFWKMQFQSPKCTCSNLSQLLRQGYISGRFLLGFSQCNSRMPDWIPAWCFDASLCRQNGFSSLIEPSSCLIWFLLNLLTYSAIISYKKAKVGPELGPKSDQELEPKSGPELEPKLGPQLGPKRGPELKDPFWPDFRSLFWNQFSFGAKFGQVQMELRVSIQHRKSPETRVTVKEMTKPTKHNWKIMQGQHQPSFQLLQSYQNYL